MSIGSRRTILKHQISMTLEPNQISGALENQHVPK